MPLQTETFTLEEAVADLEDDRDELADEIAQIPPAERTEDNDDYLELADQASDIERFLGALEWIRDEYGDDAEFSLSGLDTRDTLEVADRNDDLRAETITPTKSTGNMATIFWVAKGLDDAPFINASDDYDDKCSAVRTLPRQATDWLESRINDLSVVGDREGNSFGRLVEEKTEKYHQTSS